ncbi:MAG: hypothetical protein COS39_03620 [Hydrogenophilales bacterium CG03_land_8_20_14_0_80_62_28]|nr:hypothetical protein [Betaproteobacteria bacterium]PIV23639.1 MAG: hypothetical protein COS39_03620 [Hydrogenophilales bacterium CG03_land_8_20_14_0_80_62_28]PIW38291.1 MAG: hypothetical protein COW23_07360 [Hydrogenophilales bacterium CG15_BIG_FIL_POST_REV_8_21_14_020_62_31]PIW71640.1 MAG: hypothetical protein COW07_07185 [Hydrogenophilales bacterium CG12_big_fil_rev_8_21_14_0_65_61_21]PIX02573.1 MAG: hypothetical protein COZ79_01020 [Hydrogenophilales bacterium CG_4_8_14_3_um_filter_62_83]
MSGIMRILKHLSYPGWWLRRMLPPASLGRIEKAVADAEAGHGGQIRVALETSLGLFALLKGQTARLRAEEVFSQLRVWDTELNNGVLIYWLLADREFEIVVDRGLARAVGQEDWARLCREMAAHFQAGRHEAALLHGIEAMSKYLEVLYPGDAGDINELPDRPVIL